MNANGMLSCLGEVGRIDVEAHLCLGLTKDVILTMEDGRHRRLAAVPAGAPLGIPPPAASS